MLVSGGLQGVVGTQSKAAVELSAKGRLKLLFIGLKSCSYQFGEQKEA